MRIKQFGGNNKKYSTIFKTIFCTQNKTDKPSLWFCANHLETRLLMTLVENPRNIDKKDFVEGLEVHFDINRKLTCENKENSIPRKYNLSCPKFSTVKIDTKIWMPYFESSVLFFGAYKWNAQNLYFDFRRTIELGNDSLF